MLILEWLLGILIFIYYIRFSIYFLPVGSYKKTLFFHIVICFLSGNLLMSLFPVIAGNKINDLSAFNGLYWFSHIEIIKHSLLSYPSIFCIIAGSLAFSSLIVCFVVIYHIFFEY